MAVVALCEIGVVLDSESVGVVSESVEIIFAFCAGTSVAVARNRNLKGVAVEVGDTTVFGLLK